MLRTIHLLGLSFVVLAGCGDPNAGRLFAEVHYRVRCEETFGCGSPPDRLVCGFTASDFCDGRGLDQEAQLSCTVNQNEDNRTLTFTATQGSDFSIRVSAAVIPRDGGVAMGPACEVTVVEGANTYSGRCGSSVPSAEQPCQITNVAFFDDEGNPTISGEIFCQHLENRSNPSLSIEVTAPLDGSPAFTSGTPPVGVCDSYAPNFPPACEPLVFTLANCSGLTLP